MDSGVGGRYRDASSAVRDLLLGIGDGDLARPTPCTGWDLPTLTAHMAFPTTMVVRIQLLDTGALLTGMLLDQHKRQRSTNSRRCRRSC